MLKKILLIISCELSVYKGHSMIFKPFRMCSLHKTLSIVLLLWFFLTRPALNALFSSDRLFPLCISLFMSHLLQFFCFSPLFTFFSFILTYRGVLKVTLSTVMCHCCWQNLFQIFKAFFFFTMTHTPKHFQVSQRVQSSLRMPKTTVKMTALHLLLVWKIL